MLGSDPGGRTQRDRRSTLLLAVVLALLAGALVALAIELRTAPRSTPAHPSRVALAERPPEWRFPAVSFGRALPAHMGSVESVVFAANGVRMLTGSADETAKVWDVRQRKPLHVLRGQPGAVKSAAVTKDGRFAVTGGERSVRVWSLLDGKPVRAIETDADADGERVVSVAVSPSGRTLVGGTEGGAVEVWSFDGSLLASLPHGAGAVRAVVFSPDGTRLASGGDDSTIKLWDVADWTLRQTLWGHGGAVDVLSVAPGGDILASGGDDRTVRLWQLDHGTALKTLSLHGDAVRALAFSPDGRLLVSGGGDALLGVWALPEGTLKQRVESSVWARGTRAAAFAPDGSGFMTAHGDGELAYWQVARSGEHLPLPKVTIASQAPPSPARGLDGCVQAMDTASQSEGEPSAVALVPTNAESDRLVQADVYCVRGWNLFAHHDRAAARLAADAAQRLAPGLVPAALLSARLHLQEGEIEESEKAVVLALSRPIDRHAAASSLATLADIYENMGDVEADGEARRRAVELDPDSPVFAAQYALFLTRKGDLDQAIAMSEGVARTPAGARVRAGAYCRKGEQLLWDRGQPDSAARAFEDAIAVDPKSACAAYGLGAYYQFVAGVAGRSGASATYEEAVRQARSWYANAAGLDPTSPRRRELWLCSATDREVVFSAHDLRD